MKKGFKKISLTIEEETLNKIKVELLKRKTSKNNSISDFIGFALKCYLDEQRISSKDLSAKGRESIKNGSFENGRKLMLLAVAKEIENLVQQNVLDERIIRDYLFNIVLMLKEATGYKRLPDIEIKDKLTSSKSI